MPDRTAIPAQYVTPLLEGLARDLPVGVALLDLEGRYLFLNEALARMNGLPREEHLGRLSTEVLSVPEEVIRPVFQRVAAGESVEWNVSVAPPGDPDVVHDWRDFWYPVKDEHGEVIGQLAVVMDVTEEKEAERTLRRMATVRQQMVEVASHELRSPLTSVMGFAQQLLRRHELDPEVREGIEIIHRQALEMAFRMDLLLGLSEVDQSNQRAADVPSERIVVAELLEDEVRALRARRPEAKVDHHCEVDLALLSDGHRIRQIVANLLDNGVKCGGGVLEVSARHLERECEIEVRDFGPGIPPEEREKVFARGYRAPGAEQLPQAGRGLGLFVARRLAERLGGSLSLQSEVGQGTQFFLRLPLGE